MATASVIRHSDALRKSTEITRILRKMYWPKMSMVAPADIIAVLNRANVRFMLVGNYGFTGWRDEPRATEDVDILVQTRDYRKSVQAIRIAFAWLGLEDSQKPVRFLDPITGRRLIELWESTGPLFKVAFRRMICVAEGYRIPNLEFALACKYVTMRSPSRPQDKQFLDAADFISMVEKNSSAIRLARLRRLGERVYPGGGEDILQLVEDAKAGRRIVF